MKKYVPTYAHKIRWVVIVSILVGVKVLLCAKMGIWDGWWQYLFVQLCHRVM